MTNKVKFTLSFDVPEQDLQTIVDYYAIVSQGQIVSRMDVISAQVFQVSSAFGAGCVGEITSIEVIEQ